MKAHHLYPILIAFLASCGQKLHETPENIIKETKVYVDKIDTNNEVKTEVTKGALTDKDGFKDIGTFKYTVFSNNQTNELLKIENIEVTDKTISENYYFKNNNLIYFQSASKNSKPKKIYLSKNKIISTENLTNEEQKLFANKAKRFQKAFKETH